MNTHQKFALRLTAFLIAVISLVSLVPPQPVSAVTAADWKAGRIVDDSVFTNKAGMTPAQVQEFLNAKVPSCDTNGTKLTNKWNASAGRYYTRAEWGELNGNPAPFTCLRDYYEVPKTEPGPGVPANNYGGKPIPAGAESAAQLIWDAAQRHSINPKVLLVTIQKESNGPLTVDDWPYSWFYTYAMGAHCPDSGPGGSANCDENYAGFSIQISESARLFRYYLDSMDQSWWPYKKPGTNYVLWNVQGTGCGGGNVHIETKATAALYTYTPYQPNQAALNNMYGTGDGCSAYGNRNFWRIFNDWFGPTLGPLVRTSTSPELYYNDGTYKFHVSSMDLASQYGLGLNDVRFVSQAELDATPLAQSPSTPYLSHLVKSNSDSDEDGAALYLISSGRRIQIGSLEQLTNMGMTTSQIGYMAYHNLVRLPQDGALLSDYLQAPSMFVYKAEGGKKRGIFELATYNSMNTSGHVTGLSDFTLSSIVAGQPYMTNDAVMRGGDGKLWLYQVGAWQYIPSMEVYSCWNFNAVQTFAFTSSQAEVNETTKLTCNAKRSDGTKFLLNRVNRIAVDEAWGFASFSTPLDRTIDRLPSVGLDSTNAFRSPASSTLYVFESGQKKPIPDMPTFSKLGYTEADIITIDPGLMNSIPTGALKLASGTLVKESSGKVYVINNSDKLYITDHATFDNYGYSYSNIRNLSDAIVGAYPTSGNLSMRSLINSQPTVIEGRTRWNADADTYAHYGISASSPAYHPLISSGTTATKKATRFVKQSDTSTVYYMESGQKRPISTWNRLVELGGEQSIITLSPWAMQQFPTGPAI